MRGYQQFNTDEELTGTIECTHCLTCKRELDEEEMTNIDFDGWAFCDKHFGKYAAWIEFEDELIFKDGYHDIQEAKDNIRLDFPNATYIVRKIA